MMRWFCILLGTLATVATTAAEPMSVEQLAAKIDALIDAKLKAENVPPAPLADDAEFLRRVSLDLTGCIPTPAEVYSFLADTDPAKRTKLIDDLLARPSYAKHSAAVWRAVLAPETAAIPEARLFRPGFEAWLQQQFRKNQPYDQIARELIALPVSTDPNNPTPALSQPEAANPLAFYAVKEAKPENLAAVTTRVFLGVQIECAQCHDHPFAAWSQEQFWNQASFFAGIERNGTGLFAPIAERLDQRTTTFGTRSKVVPARYLDDTLPVEGKPLRQQLASWVTSKQNPYFARAGANRLWGQLFGRGLVDPVDDFHDENPPSHPELLELLGTSFAEADYDWAYLIRAITRTKAYQRTSAHTIPEQSRPELFACMSVKGLSGEQLFDSLVQATGYDERREGGRAKEVFLNRFAATGKLADPETSIPQALTLMNGEFIAAATDITRSKTVRAAVELPALAVEERIEWLYLSALGRQPTNKEQTAIAKRLALAGSGQRDDVLADLFWVLLNSAEFRLNH